MWIKKTIWICLLLLGFVYPFAGRAKESPEITKITDNVYARVVSPDGDAVSNAGFVVLEQSVLVFDSHFTPEAGHTLLSAIRSVTPKPVRYVVNSHAHADHTHGNQVFPDAQIIGSTAARREVLESDLPSLNRTMSVTQSQIQRLRKDMSRESDPAQLQRLRDQLKAREAYVQTMSGLKITAPLVSLDDILRIQEGKQEMRIVFLGKGHTEGDIVLFLPAQKVAFLGDLFFNEAIPNVQDAFILEWMQTLKEALKLDADKFIPGHGPVGGKKELQNFLAYFESLHDRVKESVDRGDTVDQAVRDIPVPAKYAGYMFQNFFPSNVQKMYAELKALQPPPATSPAEKPSP